MRWFLVIEQPERLEAEGQEFAILHGSVMREQGLTAWAPRVIGVDAGLPFLEIATKAREKGYAIFALPAKADPAKEGGAVVEETAVGDRKVLVRRAPDWAGSALVRYELDAGGVAELEAPGWLIQDMLSTREEVKRLRDELRVKAAEAETQGKMLDALTKECADLKAGRTAPTGRPKKAPKSPAVASEPVTPATATTTVADVKAELAATLDAEAKASAPAATTGGKKKYRGSAGDD